MFIEYFMRAAAIGAWRYSNEQNKIFCPPGAYIIL